MQQAIEALASNHLKVQRQASFYETEPVGLEDQPWFLNTVVDVQTRLLPDALLKHGKAIEAQLGRIQRQRWGPREVDIDILIYGHWIIQSPHLIVPHLRINERRFVLQPLLELLPDGQHPKTGQTFASLAAQLDDNKKVELFRRKS